LVNGAWNNSTGLYSRILVAGGGGGRHGQNYEGVNYVGNDGGGSNSPTYTVSGYTITGSSASSGGSSTYGSGVVVGSFGYANYNGNCNSYSTGGWNGGGMASDCWANGGGGGGWYGGCTSWPTGAGGSGYVVTSSSYKPGGYTVAADYYMSTSRLIAGNSEMPNSAGGVMTGRSGNGYARITKITDAPSVITNNATSPTNGSAILGGSVVDEGDALVTERGIVLSSINTSPTINGPNTQKVQIGSAWGDFQQLFSSLSSNTTYYFKAYAISSVDTIYGQIKTVTTLFQTNTEYSYTGDYQTYIVPTTGMYRLETWGAQGGNDSFYPSTSFGGRGGYSSGDAYLIAGTYLYIYVGSHGTGSTSASWGSTGGGGATDIRLVNGAWNNSAGLYSRIIVAGGGGGRHGNNYEGVSYVGNDGGGSNSPTYTVSGYTITGSSASSGGSSNYSSSVVAGSFGYANYNGNCNTYSTGGWNGGGMASDCWANGGGGGGWYGGCTSWPTGAGGSGYVATSTSYKPGGYTVGAQYYMSKSTMIAGNATMQAPAGGTITGKTGNGYCKISLLSSAPAISTNSPNSITVTSATLGGNISSQGGSIVTERGIVYSKTNPNPRIDGAGVTTAIMGNGVGIFENEVIGLEQNTHYYYCAYATNSYGTNYGSTYEFNTLTQTSTPINVSATPNSVCEGSSTELSAISPSATIYWFNQEIGGVAIGSCLSGESFEITPTGNIVYYAEARDESEIPSIRVAISVTVNPLPITPTSITASQTSITIGESTVLSYSGGSGLQFDWFTESCGSTNIGSGDNFIVSPTQTTTYYGRWQNNCGFSTCKSVSISVNPANNTWTGNVSSDWNTSGNWSEGSIPGSVTDVLITNSYSNAPIVNEDKSTPAICKNITINSDATLTINSDKGLTVNFNIINNGTVIIESNASGDGSFITNGTVTGTGTYNIKRYLQENMWHLVTSPITNAQSSVMNGIWLRPYDESTNTFGAYIVPDNIPMTTGEGFSVWTNTNETRTFVGKINNSAVTKTLQRSPDGGDVLNFGWNLIGNPYPCAIDLDAASGWTKNNVGRAVYVWDGGLSGGQYRVYLAATGTEQGIAANGGSRYVAMEQGFFVQAITDGATITMDKPIRVHNAIEFRDSEIIPDMININVSGNGYSDESVIYYKAEASQNFDFDYDAAKLYGTSAAPQLYTKKQDNLLTISSINDFDEFNGKFVYLEVGTASEYMLEFSHSMVGYSPVLTDLFTDQYIYPGQNYVFFANPDDNSQRFQFSYDLTGITEETANDISVWAFENALRVEPQNGEEIENISVYTIQGQLVMQFTELEKDLSELSPAVYVVRVNSGNEVKIEKIVIK
jgi:hypothetical protein